MSRINLKRAEKGQSLVEFSLGLVMILIIVSGLLDLGRLYFTFVALEDAAGEAALYLSLNPHCVHATDGTECANPNNADYRVRNSGGQEVDWSKAKITFDVPSPYGVGEAVKVTVQYSYGLLTPIIPRITGINPITMSASASQIIITELAKK
jgi:Flp pilus assembly protein TadG